MPVFVTYLPYQKFSRLVAGNSHEDILQTTLTWRSLRGRLSLFRYWSRLSLFLLSDVWSLSCPNSKVCREDFPLFALFVFVAAITIEPICGSGVSSKRFFTGIVFVRVDLLILLCIDSWTNEYSDPRFRIISNHASTRITNATGILLTVWLSGRFVLKLHPCSPSF